MTKQEKRWKKIMERRQRAREARRLRKRMDQVVRQPVINRYDVDFFRKEA